jgi:YYY domain-containing protein
VINEYHLSGRNETGLNPIAEVPAFSFSLGDLHPHVLALPYAFLSLGVALVWFLKNPQYESWGSYHAIGNTLKQPFFWFTALVIGGLSFLNTWDVLVHLFVLVGGIGLARWRANRGWSIAVVRESFIAALAIGGIGYLLYLPFYVGFSSQAGAPFILPMLMRPTRLAHFLVIFGMPILAITLLIGTLIVQQRFRYWQRGVATAVGLVVGLFALMTFMGFVIGVADFGRIAALADELNIQLNAVEIGSGTAERIGFSSAAIGKILPTILLARLEYPLLTLLLAFLVAGTVMVASQQFTVNMESLAEAESQLEDDLSPLAFVMLLILTGALLTIGPEFVYLRDQFGQRLNTIFKFYYQAWALFGIAAAVGLYILSQRTRLIGAIAGIGYLVLFAGSLLFPYYMIRWADASYTDTPTLDGLAFVDLYNSAEYDAIRWLQTEIDATPVILEAVGGAYSDFGRVAARTGLPTLLGWANHERQWRGADHPEPGARDPIVRQIYEQPDWFGVSDLLDQYNIDYIYVGALERSTYGEQGLAKFAENMEVAFQNEMVTIYAWK